MSVQRETWYEYTDPRCIPISGQQKFGIVFHENDELEQFVQERGAELVTIIYTLNNGIMGGGPGLKFKNEQDKIEFILKFK